MKSLYLVCFVLLSSISFAQKTDSLTPIPKNPTPPAPQTLVSAVGCWDRLAILKEPSKKAAEVDYIKFGVDDVKLTGNAVQVQEDRKRTYVEVITAKQVKGWINEYLIIPHGGGAAATATMPVYKDANSTEILGEFKQGEAFVIAEQVGQRLHVYGRHKNKIGWIDGGTASFSLDNKDIDYAIKIAKAKEEKDIFKRNKLLVGLEKNATGVNAGITQSLNDDIAQSNLEIEAARSVAPVQAEFSGKAPVVAGSASQVSRTATKEKVQKNEGTFWRYTEVLSLKQAMMEDDGNLYAYHPTLPAGTQIVLFLPENAGQVVLQIAGTSRDNSLTLSQKTANRLFGASLPKDAKIQYYTEN